MYGQTFAMCCVVDDVMMGTILPPALLHLGALKLYHLASEDTSNTLFPIPNLILHSIVKRLRRKKLAGHSDAKKYPVKYASQNKSIILTPDVYF